MQSFAWMAIVAGATRGQRQRVEGKNLKRFLLIRWWRLRANVMCNASFHLLSERNFRAGVRFSAKCIFDERERVRLWCTTGGLLNNFFVLCLHCRKFSFHVFPFFLLAVLLTSTVVVMAGVSFHGVDIVVVAQWRKRRLVVVKCCAAQYCRNAHRGSRIDGLWWC